MRVIDWKETWRSGAEKVAEKPEECKPPPRPMTAANYFSVNLATQEDIDRETSRNWEWYYHGYLYLDATIQVECKCCGHYNVFPPQVREMPCEKCGVNTPRCERWEE